MSMGGKHKLYPPKDNFKKPCACGCGELIWDRNRNGPLLFKHHHSRKGLWWFDGKPHTTLGKKRPDAAIRMKLDNPMKRPEIKSSNLLTRKRNVKTKKNLASKSQPRKKKIYHKTNWQSRDVGYAAIHYRIRKRLPKPDLCQACNKAAPYELANVSGAYLNDLSDWEWLCRRCHMRMDGRMNNLDRKKVMSIIGAQAPMS